jgi:hypothetical protein
MYGYVCFALTSIWFGDVSVAFASFAGGVYRALPAKLSQAASVYGPGWWIEIKWDGFRVIARKQGKSVRLCSRPGNDLTHPRSAAGRFASVSGWAAGRSMSAAPLMASENSRRRCLFLMCQCTKSLRHNGEVWLVLSIIPRGEIVG